MPTKVFTSADILLVASIGANGADVTAAATQITAFDGAASWTQTTDADTAGPGVVILVLGSLIDDASVPPVITMTNVHVDFDWTLSVQLPVPLPQDSFIGDDALAFNVPTGTQMFSGSGTGGGHVSDDVQNMATYYGGTSRADLFAKQVAWTAQNNWGPGAFAAHARGCSLTNYTLTVTYTTPTPDPVVTRITLPPIPTRTPAMQGGGRGRR